MTEPLHPCRRKGATVAECIMALAIIGVTLALAVEGLAAMAAQRRIVDRRTAAMIEVDQLLERVAVLPWDEVRAENIAGLELSKYLREKAPGAEIVAEVLDEEGAPAARRIAIALRWETATGEERSPQMFAWRYRPEEGTP